MVSVLGMDLGLIAQSYRSEHTHTHTNTLFANFSQNRPNFFPIFFCVIVPSPASTPDRMKISHIAAPESIYLTGLGNVVN
jgi:hypothetical protein